MTPTKKPDAEKRNAEREAALTFVRMAKEKGLDLTGPDGLLKQFTKSVLETALDEEMTEHLGRAKHKKSKDGRAANTRNGTTAKTVVTDSVGPVRIEVPRDRDGSFEPVVVRKRQRRLPGVDEVVLSLYARGLTTGEISAHFQEIYGADVSRETVSRITERVVAEKDEWCSRPLDRVYAAVFIDATVVKVRDGQVANRAFYVAVGVDLEGGRDVLGIWASPAAEGARYWLSVLTELKNRGVDDVFFLICDGLKGLPDAVGAVWPLAIVQTCVVHLLRNTCISSSRCFVFSHVFFSGLGSCMHFPYFSGCAEVFLPNMRASLTRRLWPVNSRSRPWCTMRSMIAAASLSSAKTVPHLLNSMFVVNMMLRLS